MNIENGYTYDARRMGVDLDARPILREEHDPGPEWPSFVREEKIAARAHERHLARVAYAERVVFEALWADETCTGTSPDDLELCHSPADVTVKRVVLLDRETGPRRPVRAEELGTIDAIEALLPQTSALNRLPRPLHALTDLFDRAGPVIRLTYHEASDLVPLAPQLLEETA